MIDIIIPAYNAHNYISNLLFSIAMQTVIDKINVYLINDCSSHDYKEIINKFKGIIKIKEYKTSKNSGPGASRQLGLEKSHGKYVLFIDADDIFYNSYSIETLYNKIETENLNAVSANFIEELYDGSYNYYGENAIWMHGKIYRRNFLEKNNIHFNNSRANEDTGFNKLILAFTDFSYIDDYVYIWKYNENSITRSSDYAFYGLEGLCNNICWAIKEAKKRKANEKRIAYIVYESIMDMYYRYVYYKDRDDKYLILDWSNELEDYYKYYEKKLDDKEKEEIIFNVINFMYHSLLKGETFINIKITFNDFINEIENRKKKAQKNR